MSKHTNETITTLIHHLVGNLKPADVQAIAASNKEGWAQQANGTLNGQIRHHEQSSRMYKGIAQGMSKYTRKRMEKYILEAAAKLILEEDRA